MNRINKSNVVILMAAVLFLFASCRRELDVAPVAVYDGQATHTIAQLLTYHVPGSIDSYDTLPHDMVIQGTVISSDQEGNCYKYITIDDGTAGIQVKINSNPLYNNFPLGQHVYIKCDGLVLGDYRKLLQLGWWENDGMQGISSNKLYKYIFKDGLPGPNPEPSIELTSANQLQDNMYSRLVRLKNVRFEDPGQLFASGTSSDQQSRIIKFEDGTSIILYTSYYANFASQATPRGKFDMVALLGRNNAKNQVVIRSLKDIGIAVSEDILCSMDIHSNPLENGWITQAIEGNPWTYIPGNAVRVVSGAGNTDSWLVTPAINTSAYNNLTISFTHGLIGTANCQVCYSTDYTGGDVANANWIPLDGISYNTVQLVSTVTIPANALNSSNLRIGFRYRDMAGSQGKANSQWIISSFEAVSIVER